MYTSLCVSFLSACTNCTDVLLTYIATVSAWTVHSVMVADFNLKWFTFQFLDCLLLCWFFFFHTFYFSSVLVCFTFVVFLFLSHGVRVRPQCFQSVRQMYSLADAFTTALTLMEKNDVSTN